MNKDEALDILRDLHEKSLFSERKALEIFVPELKESEDERIRKFLIKMVRNGHGGDKKWWNKCVDWLERQRKHKFDIGDTISNGDIEYRVVDIVKNCVNNDCYSLRRAGKIVEPFLWDCEEADELFEKL